MASEDTQVDRSDILSHLMSKDGQQPRDEPEIAANIGQQLQHMGLTTWSISIHRRLRDALVRLSPQSVLEVGASIGHRTAWLLMPLSVNNALRTSHWLNKALNLALFSTVSLLVMMP